MKRLTAARFLETRPDAVLVTIQSAKGSTPREAGAFMLVSDAAIYKTIGGGQLEYMAIDKARQMLRSGLKEDAMEIGLGPEIGQCCGGRVTLALRRTDEELAFDIIGAEERDLDAMPHIYVFGAGHVGNALCRALGLLPVRTILVDTRQAELDAAPEGVEKRIAAMPESLVEQAPSGSAFLVLTHDHALDFLILKEALARADAAYVGMIGSKSKRATFKSWLLRERGEEAAFARLVCPMGGPAVRDKRPEVIAALTAAEVMTALNAAKGRQAAASAQTALEKIKGG
jgi:xanthine dehydrogenase accessory factor